MKIGILGGTFDPIHIAHVEMAKAAKSQYSLDKVLIMPSAKLPHKDNELITDSNHRVNMIKLAIEGLKGIEFSDFELNLDRVTYTAVTLELLKEQYKNDELFFIMGSDSIASFMSWYQPEKILELATILVVKREDESFSIMNELIQEIEEKYDTEIKIISMKSYDISSSEIRLNIDGNIKNKVPSQVYDYIIEHGLYKNVKVNKAWSLVKIIDDLKSNLKSSRMEHTLGVAQTSKIMAEAYNVNPNKAYMAGILHDCAKNLDENQLFDICTSNNIPISETEENAKFLLHAKVGEYIARTKYGITDEEILSSIRWHTTGKPNMTKLEQIIFCADYIEPNRTKQKNLPYLRDISLEDLDLLTYNILKDTMEYLKERGGEMDLNTELAYNYYKNLVKGE